MMVCYLWFVYTMTACQTPSFSCVMKQSEYVAEGWLPVFLLQSANTMYQVDARPGLESVNAKLPHPLNKEIRWVFKENCHTLYSDK